MSALPPQSRHREFATTCLLRAKSGCEQSQQGCPLFDHLVGGYQQLVGHREAEHPGSQMAAAFRKGLGETGLLIVVLALVKPLSPPGDLSRQLICGPIEA